MITKGDERSGAIFSDDMLYRYSLWRCWDACLPRACFCLMNPSTADEIDNDPTIERQQRRVQSWVQRGLYVDVGFQVGSIEIVNAFGYRATNNRTLYRVADPIGADNNAAILNATTAAIGSRGIVVCGWGNPTTELPRRDTSRHNFLCDFFQRHNIPVSAFALNTNGAPVHPLYISYDAKPREWNFTATLGAEVV